MDLQATLPPDIATNPLWYLYDYSPASNDFTFTSLDESQYRDAAFLDSRLHSRIKQIERVDYDAVDRAFPKQFSQVPAAYIFQIGHCGSTLLSRCLGTTPAVLSLREPGPLGALAKLHRELGEPLAWLDETSWERLKMIIMLALERRFRADQLPVIKANSICNNLAEAVLATHPDRRAIFLYQSLETTLAAMFKAPGGRGDLRKQARHRLQEWQLLTKNCELHLSTLKAHELAVMSWMASMQRFTAAEVQFPERTIRVDFDAFLARPDKHLEDLAKFLGIESEAQTMVEEYGNVSQYYSKNTSRRFSPLDRQYTLDVIRSRQTAVINAGLDFAQRLMGQFPFMSGLAAHLGR
jgi:hypothetical protein